MHRRPKNPAAAGSRPRGLTNLQSLSRQAIKRTAISTAGLIFAALNVVAISPLRDRQDHQPIAILAIVLLSSVGLVTIVTVLERVLLHHWARPILGPWLYVSDSGNYGFATIEFHGDELFYLVELYPSASELLSAFDGTAGARTEFFARALSKAVAYDPARHELRLIYGIEDVSGGYDRREGMLVLTVHDADPTMTGFWKSDYEDVAARARGEDGRREGRLKLFRPEEFRAILMENPARLQPPSTTIRPSSSEHPE